MNDFATCFASSTDVERWKSGFWMKKILLLIEKSMIFCKFLWWSSIYRDVWKHWFFIENTMIYVWKMINFQWKMHVCCAFFNAIYTPGTMKVTSFHVKKHEFWRYKWMIFVTFFAPSVYRERWKVVIFQEEHDADFAWKMHDFWAILMSIHIPGTCFLHVFSRFFSTRKSLETFLLQRIWMAILPQIFFVKKRVFFCWWKTL